MQLSRIKKVPLDRTPVFILSPQLGIYLHMNIVAYLLPSFGGVRRPSLNHGNNLLRTTTSCRRNSRLLASPFTPAPSSSVPLISCFCLPRRHPFCVAWERVV